MIHHYTTLAEVKRTCVLVASTDQNYHRYNEAKAEADKHGVWEMVMNSGDFSIYANDLYYIVVHQNGAILKLYKSIKYLNLCK